MVFVNPFFSYGRANKAAKYPMAEYRAEKKPGGAAKT